MADYVKYSVPKELSALQTDVVKKISKTGKIKIGINEVTKNVERNNAKLVLIAEDISPEEIIMHLPVLCKDKKIPFTYVATREELGKIAGISAKASCISVADEGVAKKEFTSLVNKIEEVIGGKDKPKKEETKKETPKKEAKKEEVKKEEVKKEEPKKEEVKKEEPKKEEVKKEEPKKEE